MGLIIVPGGYGWPVCGLIFATVKAFSSVTSMGSSLETEEATLAAVLRFFAGALAVVSSPSASSALRFEPALAALVVAVFLGFLAFLVTATGAMPAPDILPVGSAWSSSCGFFFNCF